MAIIVVEQLKYRYPGANNLALDNISFHLKKGEMLGVIGRNGAGKSTLCQSLVGLVPHFYKGAYGGRVLIDGIEVKQATISELSMKVGFVFQNPHTQITGAKETVYEEIAFGLENMGISRDEMKDRIDEALSVFGLLNFKDRSPFHLSGGQIQRMAIAGMIAMKPDIMVLDEPTSQLDPQGRSEVYEVIQQLKKRGMTIIISDHRTEKLAEYCDQIILLDQGKLIDMNTPEQIFSKENLEDYGVQKPVYTAVCQRIQKRKDTGEFPVTLAQTVQLLRRKG